MLLTFNKEKRFFTLHFTGATDGKARTVVEESKDWELLVKKPLVYSTTSFKAVKKFKRWADKPTARLLERAFVKHTHFDGKLPSWLDTHQVEGVAWALTRSRSYLAHAPGAGKTIEALTAATYVPGTAVFIVPPSLVENWKNEAERFLPKLGVFLPAIDVVPESARQAEMDWEADYIIVPDSMLHKEWVLSRLLKLKIGFLSLDEASRFKEVGSVRTLAVFGGKKEGFASPGLIFKAKRAVLLDGSPMPNRSIELWAPTYAMYPECIDFMSEKQFAFAFCDPKQNERGEWEFKGSTNSEDLKRRLQESFMHVVPEERLGHSPRLRSLVFLEDGRTADVKAWEKKWIGSYIERRLKPEAFEIFAGEKQGELATMRKEAGIAMVKPAAKYIRERLETGEAVLVFAWHREVCMTLAKELEKYKPGLIIGGTSGNDREAFLTSFQGGKRNLLIMNIAAGGRGHNIQRADRVIFVEPSWSDEQNKQCEKRASRRGRSKDLPVKADYLVVKGSINELVLSSAFTKEARVKKVIG